MFGIMTQDGLSVLFCRSGTNVYFLRRRDQGTMPVMRKSALEIDQLLQDYMSASGYYNLVVFKFTAAEVEDLLIKKLKGY